MFIPYHDKVNWSSIFPLLVFLLLHTNMTYTYYILYFVCVNPLNLLCEQIPVYANHIRGERASHLHFSWWTGFDDLKNILSSFCFRNYVNKVVNVFSRRIFPWPVIIYSDWKISTINCVCHVFFLNVIRYNDQQWNG